MPAVVELAFPPRPDYLALARMLVGAAAATEPLFPDERIDDLRLAVSEACTNAIEAQLAAGGDDPGLVAIRCEVEAMQVTVVITDEGGGFDPDLLSAHPPVTDPRRLDFDHGLGIPLIRALSDEVEYTRTPRGTAVRMVLLASGTGRTAFAD